MIEPGRYQHFKGNEYEVVAAATHSETEEEMVVYRAIAGDGRLWVRPASMWSEQVENNGLLVTRFTPIAKATSANEAIAPEPAKTAPAAPLALPLRERGIHKASPPADKVKLFLSLFAGREDVFAERWENLNKGTAGYSPHCHDKKRCLKPGHKLKCGECPRQNFVPYDASAIEKHLLGLQTYGVYPLLPDESCRFLAFDFDGKDYSPDELLHAVGAIREVCVEKGLSLAVERSRSGQGVHFWIFFTENIPASVARRFGSSLVTYAMKKHNLPFKTYDRMIPAQDTLPKGGFGNLIALPLQKQLRPLGNTEFVDADFQVYPDQWAYLDSLHKYTPEEIDWFTRQLAPTGELGELRQDAEEEKPWEVKKSSPKLTRADLPATIATVRANMFYLEKAGLSLSALNTLKRLAAFHNPKFYEKQALRLSTHEIPRIISCSEETTQYLCLPRGLASEATEFLANLGVKVDSRDETNPGRTIDVSFRGDLRDEQPQAAAALLAHDMGILSATTGFGKTVIGAYLIGQRRVNTLILVHRTSLLALWLEELYIFLEIKEEPAIELTPKGRKRKKNKIGQIGGGKNNLSGIIDVAVMQSLVSGDEVKDLVKNYGMIIIDECHHLAAFSFEQILKAVNAKYVYGLTATPTRKDGHHPIIYMQCGKIRYHVDPKAQAEARPFDHYVIPRFTRFQKPAHRGEDWTFNDIYEDIQNNELRNSLILQDVIRAVEQGRSPLILSERTKHVQYLSDQLSSKVKNVIALTGDETAKKKRETLQAVSNIPIDEPFVLVATGKYVGEGFNMPRLDTLFLTMPISWKGTLQQYVGRLHRLYAGKKEVQVYDYVDIYVGMLQRMHEKRLRGYAAIGYKAKVSEQLQEDTHIIFDNWNFFPVYTADVLAGQHEVLIVSPFLAQRRVSASLPYLTAASTHMTVITKPPESYKEKDREKIAKLLELLTERGITIKTKNNIHQKFAIIDQRLVWYGSINLLSYGTSEESIMRIENVDIAGELLRSVQ
jgi:superfamily II DNA or RNA helicase